MKLTVSLRNQQQFFSNKPDYTITACLISDQWSTCRNIIFFFIYIVYIYTRVVVVCDVVDTLRFDYTITISMSCFILFCVFTVGTDVEIDLRPADRGTRTKESTSDASGVRCCDESPLTSNISCSSSNNNLTPSPQQQQQQQKRQIKV